MNTVNYGLEWYVEKTKSILSQTVAECEKIDCMKIQILMNRNQMPSGYNKAMKVYEKLIEDGFLVRDKNNLGAYINKGGEK